MIHYPLTPLVTLKAPGRYSMVGGPFGSKLVRSDYIDNGVPVIRGGNLPDSSRFSYDDLVFVSEEKVANDLFGNLAYPGDIVITQRGTLGQVGLIPDNSPYPRLVVSQSQMKITVDQSKANPAFIYYALKAPVGQHEIRSRAITAGVPHINLSLFQQLRIPLPPLRTQRKIAAILSAYDDLIENHKRRIAILEELAQRICREWFVDLRYPGHEGVPLVDSELGPIPQAWRIVHLEEVADLVRGRSYRSSELVESGGVPFVNLKCMKRGGGFREDGLKSYVGDFKPEQCVRTGDIVLAVTDLTQGREILARATLVPQLAEDFGVISLDVAKIAPHDPDDRLALFCVLRFSDFSSRVKELANGSTVLHLSPGHVSDGLVAWPDQVLRNRLTEVVGPLVNQIEALSRLSLVLAQCRDLLLPRLINGEVGVTDLDISMSEEAA